MKILHTVEFYSPSVGGAQEVVRQLSEHLVILGHDVTVATSRIPNRSAKIINGVKIIDFDVSGNAVNGYSGEDVHKYQKLLTSNNFDVIMNYAAQQWTTDLAFEVIDQITAKKILVPCGYSGLFNPSYQDYFNQLPTYLDKYDKIVYLSPNYRDINFALKHGVRNHVIIPNGADEREFTGESTNIIPNIKHKIGINLQDKLILHVGSHTGLKGHKESIKAFINTKLPNTTLLILGDGHYTSGCSIGCKSKAIGQNLSNKFTLNNSNQRIIVTNLSRADTIAAFQSADLFLFLSNIECSPLVLFEAAASGTPFVASNAGNSREIAEWTKCGLIARSKTDINGYTRVDIRSASKLIKKILDDPILYERMSKSGRSAWKRKFTWEKIAKEYEKLYEKN